MQKAKARSCLRDFAILTYDISRRKVLYYIVSKLRNTFYYFVSFPFFVINTIFSLS